jgi:hypothetical protein
MIVDSRVMLGFVLLLPSDKYWTHMKLRIIFIALLAITCQTFAQPIKVNRFDDADEFLPKAEQRNKNKIRLFLRQQDEETLFKVTSPRNVTVDVISNVPANAEYGVIFLLGGTSVLSIVNERLDRSFSFQPRSRDYWWKNNFATFLVDAPSDRLDKNGIGDTLWRTGKDHQADLQAVVLEIEKRFKMPLIIHGHSNGAISNANIAQLKIPSVKAFIYSGSAFMGRGADILSRVEHSTPVLIIHHRSDRCSVSPSNGVKNFVERLSAPEKVTLWVEGGVDAMSGDCGPFAPHSFIGREEATINLAAEQIKQWLPK